MRVAPAFAGQFYPGRASELTQMLDAWFAEREPFSPPPEALLLPHAGYVYSGRTSALALASAARATPGTVVLAGPSHRVAVDGAVALAADGFDTPLGPLLCDRDLTADLVREVEGLELAEPFPEHSLEVQLPMLRRVWPDAQVVALAFGTGDLGLAERLAAQIAPRLDGGQCVFVASSDLSHYHDRDRATVLDARFRRLLTDSGPDHMLTALCEGETEACGAGPVLTFMELARLRGGEIVIVDQRDSGHASGDTDQVVGYLSAALRPQTP